MSSLWVGIGSAVLGAGVSLYGQNRQQQANNAATQANQQSIGNADLSAWQAYLAQRGVNPSGVTQFGQIPQNIQAINTKLPLWANVQMNPAGVAARTNVVPGAVSQPAPAARQPFLIRRGG